MRPTALRCLAARPRLAVVAALVWALPLRAQLALPLSDTVRQRMSPPTADTAPIASVMTGTRLRISFGSSSMAGALKSATRDSFTVSGTHAEQTVARSSVTRIEVSAGSHTNTAKFAMYGLAGGAALGAVLGQLASGPKCHSVTSPHCDGIYIHEPAGLIGGSILFGLMGAGTGAIIGHLHHTEQWTSMTSQNQ